MYRVALITLSLGRRRHVHLVSVLGHGTAGNIDPLFLQDLHHGLVALWRPGILIVYDFPDQSFYTLRSDPFPGASGYAAVEKVLDLFEDAHIIENVREVAPYLEQRLEEIKEKYDCILERRGVGLMQGLVFDGPVREIIDRAVEKGLILINAGVNIVRFVPPLVISKENVDEMIGILDSCIRSGE